MLIVCICSDTTWQSEARESSLSRGLTQPVSCSPAEGPEPCPGSQAPPGLARQQLPWAQLCRAAPASRSMAQHTPVPAGQPWLAPAGLPAGAHTRPRQVQALLPPAAHLCKPCCWRDLQATTRLSANCKSGVLPFPDQASRLRTTGVCAHCHVHMKADHCQTGTLPGSSSLLKDGMAGGFVTDPSALSSTRAEEGASPGRSSPYRARTASIKRLLDNGTCMHLPQTLVAEGGRHHHQWECDGRHISMLCRGAAGVSYTASGLFAYIADAQTHAATIWPPPGQICF